MVRWAGCTAWQAIARSAMRWVPGRSPSRGRGRSATGPTCCPKTCAPMRMCSCWARRPAALSFVTWASWPRRSAGSAPVPDTDGDDGFAGRSLRLDTTFEGAGKLDGNLSPQCAAALQAVLDALGKRRGPEDERTKGQRLHDALEDACRRLAGSGCLPERAGQPTQIVLHLDLDRLRGLPGAPEAEAAWAGQATAGPVMTATRRSSRWSPAESTPACWTASPQPCCTAPHPGQPKTARLHPPPSARQPLAAPATARRPPPQTSPTTPVRRGRHGQSGPRGG